MEKQIFFFFKEVSISLSLGLQAIRHGSYLLLLEWSFEV